jgi:hypothetical protein
VAVCRHVYSGKPVALMIREATASQGSVDDPRAKKEPAGKSLWVHFIPSNSRPSINVPQASSATNAGSLRLAMVEIVSNNKHRKNGLLFPGTKPRSRQ